MTGSRSRLAATLALVGVALGIAVLLAELAARHRYQPVPVRRVWDPFAYRIPTPGLVDIFEGLDGKTMTVRLDGLGMRTWLALPHQPRPGAESVRAPKSEPVQVDTTPEPIRLVFLGGSTTENYPFAEPDTFPGLVGAAVATAVGRPVEVRNAGASGATTAVTLGRLQHQVLDLQPDLVVVMHAINDLVAGFAPGYRADQRHLAMPPPTDPRSASRLLAWLRARRPRVLRPASVPAVVAPAIEDWSQHPSFAPFARNLRSILAIARAHGLPLLVVTQPTTYATGDDTRFRLIRRHRERGIAIPDSASLARGMAAFNAAARAAATEAGSPVFELERAMAANESLFLDECHYTRAGNREVARHLSPMVIELVRSFDDG